MLESNLIQGRSAQNDGNAFTSNNGFNKIKCKLDPCSYSCNFCSCKKNGMNFLGFLYVTADVATVTMRVPVFIILILHTVVQIYEIHIQLYYLLLKSFAPGNFAQKCMLKLVKPFSVGFLAKTFVAFRSCRCKTLAFEVGHVQNAKFWCDNLCLFFSLSHLPFSFASLASFLPFCWAFSWHFSGNRFWKSF